MKKEDRIVVVLSPKIKRDFRKKCKQLESDMGKQLRLMINNFISKPTK